MSLLGQVATKLLSAKVRSNGRPEFFGLPATPSLFWACLLSKAACSPTKTTAQTAAYKASSSAMDFGRASLAAATQPSGANF